MVFSSYPYHCIYLKDHQALGCTGLQDSNLDHAPRQCGQALHVFSQFLAIMYVCTLQKPSRYVFNIHNFEVYSIV